MNTIHCRIAGCDSKFETTEAVSTGATFLCAKHPRSVQVEAVGRKYDPIKDEKDSELAFQDCQFDPYLHRLVDGRQIEKSESDNPDIPQSARVPDQDGDWDQDAVQKAERNE